MIFADGDDFVFFDGEGVVVSFVGFVVIPIFEKDFDALLDSVFFHGYEINYMLVVKNFLELINKEGFLGETMKLFSEWLQEAAGIATSRAQCQQGDEPSFAGACSNDPPARPKRKKKGLRTKLKKFRKKRKLKDEASVAGNGQGMNNIGPQGGTADGVVAGAGTGG